MRRQKRCTLLQYVVEIFDEALRPRKVPSKSSTRLCDPEKCRRNLRKGFATSKSAIEIFEKALRPRKVPSKSSKRLCDLEKCHRNLRRGFATSKSAVEIFDKTPKAFPQAKNKCSTSILQPMPMRINPPIRSSFKSIRSPILCPK